MTDVYDLYDRHRPPDRQLPPVAALADFLAASPRLHGFLHHDGSGRSRSRTSGWLHRESISQPWAPCDYDDAADYVIDHLEYEQEQAFRRLRLGPQLDKWDERIRRDEILRARRVSEEGPVLGEDYRTTIASVQQEKADSTSYLIYKAIGGARRAFMMDNAYSRRVMQALRADDRIRLVEGERVFGDGQAAAWLRSLERGAIPRPELWRRYDAAGRPGDLGKHRLYHLAADTLGPPRQKWQNGRGQMCFTV